MLGYAKIFARMKPVQKQKLVKLLRERRYQKVAFVGDGVNDNLAIREADVSFSLSTSDSAWISDFSSKKHHLGNFYSLLLQGKCVL